MDPNQPVDPKHVRQLVKLMCIKPTDEEIALHQALMRLKGLYAGPEPAKRDYYIKPIPKSST